MALVTMKYMHLNHLPLHSSSKKALIKAGYQAGQSSRAANGLNHRGRQLLVKHVQKQTQAPSILHRQKKGFFKVSAQYKTMIKTINKQLKSD